MSNGSELKSRKPALPEGQQLIRVAQEIATWSEEAPEVRDLLAQLDTLRVSVPVLAEALTIFADDLLARRMHWKVTEKVGEASMSLIDAATSLMQAQQRLVRMYEGQLLQEESGITVTQETPDPRRRRRS